MAICLVIAICSAGQGHAGPALQPMTVQLDWLTNVEFAGILLAKNQGWYEEAGIDLTVKGWKPGISQLDEVITGNAQICLAGGAEFIVKRANGAKIKAVAVQFQRSPYCLITKSAKGIETPKDLVGKKVGISAADAALVTEIMLVNQGLKYSDIQPVDIAWQLRPFTDDQVDAAVAYMTNEPLALKAMGYEVSYIPAFRYGYDFYSEVFVVKEEMIQKQPELIRKFLDISFRGWRETFKDPEATAAMIVETYYPEGDLLHQTGSLKRFQHLLILGVGKELIGFMDEEYWKKGIDILKKFNWIKTEMPARDLFTLKFLQRK
jgi:ABC-type nitrate/sulfonate/bicarbonate transport system substrate-binding protein